jgi:hypothetical protein
METGTHTIFKRRKPQEENGVRPHSSHAFDGAASPLHLILFGHR